MSRRLHRTLYLSNRNEQLKAFAEAQVDAYNDALTRGAVTVPYPQAALWLLELLSEWDVLIEQQDIPNILH